MVRSTVKVGARGGLWSDADVEKVERLDRMGRSRHTGDRTAVCPPRVEPRRDRRAVTFAAKA